MSETERLIDELFLGIESRGRHASGIAVMPTNGNMFLEKSDTEASKFVLWRRGINPKAKTIMLHTRWATKGDSKIMNNNHPIEYENAIITHNGHISNDDELFEKEELKRIAQVDSEIIAGLFNKYGIDKAHIPLQKLDGNYAVAAMDTRKPNSLVLAKGHSSPLAYVVKYNAVIWASTDNAIKDACKKVLDWCPTWQEINHLSLGDLLLIEHGRIDKLQFEPFKKFTTYRSSSFWNREDDDRSTSYGGWEYHSGRDTRQLPVVRQPKNHGKPWRIIKDGVEIWMVLCDECNKANKKSDCWEINEFWVCNDCIYDSDALDDVSDSDANKMDQKTLIDELNEEITKELEEEHEAIIELVAERHGQSDHFVEWVLFEASDDMLQNSDYLTDWYMNLSESYDEIQKELTENLEFSFTGRLLEKEEAKVEEKQEGLAKKIVRERFSATKEQIGL